MSEPLSTAAPPAAPAPQDPVTAAVVPSPHSPWQFGLRAFLGLIAVCCVQFALMKYLTVLGGLGLSLGLCLAALAIMMFTAVCVVGSRSPVLEKMDYYGIRLVLAIAILFLGTLFSGGGMAAWLVASEMQLAVNLETELGIRTRSIQIYDKKGTYNALHVLNVTSGGVADKAGIRKGEVIYFDDTQSAFYHRLADNRGKPVDVNVAIGATSGSLDTCPKRAVTITLPP